MALCVYLDASTGQITSDATPPADCSGYVLLDAADYTASIAVQPFFGLPSPDDAAVAWGIGFVLPMTLALISWAIASVVHSVK